MSEKSNWESFKDITGIHGFAEYRVMGSTVARLLLVLVCLAVLGFCTQQLYGLCTEYAKHKPTTKVEMSQGLKLPDVGILLPSRELLNRTSVDPRLQRLVGEMVLEAIEDHGFPCGWMPDPPGYVDGDEAEGDEDSPEPTPNPYYTSYHPTAADVYHLNKELRGVMPTDKELFESVRLIKRKRQKASIPHASSRITNRGPVYKLMVSNHTASQVDSLKISMRTKHLPEYYHFMAGTALEYLDPIPALELERGVSYIINTRFVHYLRDKRYCDHKTTSGLSCASDCVLKAGGCVPYLGELSLAGHAVCGFQDFEQCEAGFKSCQQMCDVCHTCRPCAEVYGSSQVVEMFGFEDDDGVENEGSEGAGLVTLTVNFPDGSQVQRFIEQEAFSLFSFLSQVGGTMGLCFGISFITIYHFMYSLVVIAWDAVRGKRSERTDAENAQT